MSFWLYLLSSAQHLCLWVGVYRVATWLVKLLKKVWRTESTGINEIKNQNTSSTPTEARPLWTYMKFKEFKGLLCIFPNVCINCVQCLHHTVSPYPSEKWTLVSCFLERCLSGMEKIHFFPWRLPVRSLPNAETRKWDLRNQAAPQCHSWKLCQDKTMWHDKCSTC